MTKITINPRDLNDITTFAFISAKNEQVSFKELCQKREDNNIQNFEYEIDLTIDGKKI
jgi:hypothetical protein